ncbi:MAG TPA: PAS domain-containing sensor histidine kinase [Cytophagaceae bacterium]
MQEKRIEEINNLLIQLAAGDFTVRGSLTENLDEFDAIVTGINMLGEELESSTVSRDYLNSIMRGIVDMLIVLTPDNIIQSINSSVTDILGYEESEIVGESINVLFSQNSINNLQEINAELEEKGYSYNIERVFQTKDGKKIPVSCSASLLYNNAQEVTGILYIVKDILKIKQTEEELLRKNKELDTFIYKAAHDLKGPLTSIMGLTNIAPLEVKDQVALNYFEYIKRCAIKLDRILTNLREIAAIDKLKKDKQKIELISKINDILKLIKDGPNFDPDKIKIEVSINVRNDFFSNERMLDSILYNLIDNSCKFRKEEGECLINIQIEEKANEVCFIIQDNGIGIKKKFHEKVFDMFFRANTQVEGSGLGLYIVKNNVSNLGGTIQLKSKEGQGTVLTFSLPSSPTI